MSPEELLIKQKISYLPRGADLEVRCLNPKHEDRNPSMKIDKITGVFNCLSCGFRGNIFSHFGQKPNFLEMQRQLLRSKIVSKMAENVGLDLPKDAVDYEGDWRNISPETYKKFEAFQSADKQHVGRIVFPIRSISGKIAGFNGRHTAKGTNAPKYLITPAGAKLPLFPSNADIFTGNVILVEGIYDMLNLHDKGLTNAVCCFGTQKLMSKEGREKLLLLKLRGVTGVDIFFDPDDAGQEAAEKVKGLCEQAELLTRNIKFSGYDPGDLSLAQVQKLKESLYG